MAHIISDSQKPKTNADRIRAMSDEELADFILSTRFLFFDGKNAVLHWLQQPAEED